MRPSEGSKIPIPANVLLRVEGEKLYHTVFKPAHAPGTSAHMWF
jgi:hypothetical protein